MTVNQGLIDQVADMSVEDFAAAGGPRSVEDWVAKARLGATQSVELGCEEDLVALLIERAGELRARGPAGESLITDFLSNLSAE